MKIFLFPLLLMATSVFSQPIHKATPANLTDIDTIKFTYSIPGIINAVSFVPQLRGDSYVSNKINKDIKRFFIATSIISDSAAFIKNFLDLQEVNSVEEYIKRKVQEQKDNPDNLENHEDEKSEGFNIEYFSDNFINISFTKIIVPYHGRSMFYCNSICYDLRNGDKLTFNDFFKISNEKLIEILNKKAILSRIGMQIIRQISGK